MIESLNRNSTGIVWKSQFSTIIMEFGIDPEVFLSERLTVVGRMSLMMHNGSNDFQCIAFLGGHLLM